MKQRVTLAIELKAGAEPPSEFRIFAAGLVETTKGLFQFTASSCASVMAAAAAWDNDYPIDYEHASLMAAFSSDPAEAGKAAGWFKPEVRGGELWATSVSWTPKAAEKLKAREFRYMSPTFAKADDGTITELLNVALTNLPATHNLEPLVASRVEPSHTSHQEKTMKQLLISLGLAETASEADALTALGRFQAIVALTGKTTADEAAGVITAWKAGAEKAVELSTKLEAAEKAAAAKELEDLIATGKAAGKLTPALEPWARTAGLASLKSFLAAAAPVVSTTQHQEPDNGSGGAIQLTREEADVARLMGLDPKKVAASKAAKTAAA